ncbi:DUF1565 domain-containing protein [Candidatus Avoscillospira sp. LCP25S3_F1]|uniref:DUF1565 domain-containing protein n=1 Tax=Candidatus Avoscillospira sp. LCP25S3_F1 TaxID=3438825 RepID=UPI003F8DB1CC
MKKKALSILLTLALCLSLLPAFPAAAAAAEMRDLYVSDSGTDNSGFGTSQASPYKTLEYALEQAQTGDTIHIIGTVVTEQTQTDIPLIIDKGVTIEGDDSGILKISHAGIILGNYVTFSNLALGFSNPVRNGIIANGHSLTMKNVTKPDNTGFSTHLFAGGLSDTNLQDLPPVGDFGHILLSGKVEVGEIHAGGLSDVSVNDLGTKKA